MIDVINDTDNIALKDLYNNRDVPFIGYLTPRGLVMDYKYPLGLVGHSNNAMTDYFKQYILPIEFIHFGTVEEKKHI